MDDNKLLTLANGERIRLQPHCAMLFEVGDLQYASPATVSRCGMVTDEQTEGCVMREDDLLLLGLRRPERLEIPSVLDALV